MNEKKFRTGELEDGTRLMQAPFNYVEEANRTLSPSWHGDKVAKSHFLGRINSGIDAANKIDQVKKTLFYGRDNNLVAPGQTNLDNALVEKVSGNAIHGIIGIFTEAGELLEAMRKGYNDDIGIDVVNVKEELGDLFWYVAILAKEFGFTFDDIQRVNIAKLRLRFPAAFEADYANNRDLAGERAILEGKAETFASEAFAATGGGVMSDAQVEVAMNTPIIVPSNPASGPLPVKAVEAKAKAAFDAMKAVVPDTVDAGEAMSPTPDMAKSIGERKALMPGENLARQPIRKSDIEK